MFATCSLRRRFCLATLTATAAALLGPALAGCGRNVPSRRARPVALRPVPARPAPAAEIMPGVVAPRLRPENRNATSRAQAIESIGSYETQDWTVPTSPLVNVNGHYWARLVDLAWRRDIEIHLDHVPVDLDADGTVDTHVTRHVSLRGGILGNPEAFGLPRDDDDPAGRRGFTSVSSGYSGLRHPIDAEGRPTDDVAMTCWMCHAGRNPIDGRVVYGLASTTLDYGLMLATSSLFDPAHVLDLDEDGSPDSEDELRRRTRLPETLALDADGDGRVTSGEYRAAVKLPDARQVQATLMLGGPGRADLTNEFGLDMSPPGLHSKRYAAAATVRTGIGGVFNPKSIPHALGVQSLSVINWAASYATRGRDWLARYAEVTGQTREEALSDLELTAPAFLADPARVNRAIVLDMRSVGAIGLQADSFPGLMYVRTMRDGPPLPPALARGLRQAYAATAIRRLLYETPVESLARPALDAARVARGRALFQDAIVGEIRNQQILVDVPRVYQTQGPATPAPKPPLLAPIDDTLPMEAKLPVRCVSCHSATTTDAFQPIPPEGLAIPRCTDCHTAHPRKTLLGFRRFSPRPPEEPLVSIFPLFGLSRTDSTAREVVETCRGCHVEHPALSTPVTLTSCLILPFDADGDGRAQGDEADDLAAAGIGTDAFFAFEVVRRDLPDKNVRVPITRIAAVGWRGAVETISVAGPWVRTPPLLALFASAPYLHNGSVPSLSDLLEPSTRRPARFPVGRGAGALTFDTTLPGNRSFGHEFGVRLSPEQKRDLIEYLRSL